MMIGVAMCWLHLSDAGVVTKAGGKRARKSLPRFRMLYFTLLYFTLLCFGGGINALLGSALLCYALYKDEGAAAASIRPSVHPSIRPTADRERFSSVCAREQCVTCLAATSTTTTTHQQQKKR